MKNDEKNIQTAKETLKTEVLNLNYLVEQLDDLYFSKKFLQFLHILETCKGRILVSGVGKSGIIGKKISSVFSSIGFASFFIHPTEAIHGDLGCICKNDILLVISCSGETVEVRDIVQYCKKNKIDVLSITCKKKSWLELNSKINLTLKMNNEAVKDFPIPTTSSLLTLAICDAITSCLVKNSKLSYKKYGEIHCGGKIGKTMKNKK
jgi:arabinose-5-phosphate isomerase